MKINIEITEDNILDLLNELPIEIKQKALEGFTFDAIVLEIDRHLRGNNYDFNCWSTSGYRGGSLLREAILKINGLEEEYRKDKDEIINTLERKCKNFEKYYNKMFELYREEKIPREYMPN